MNFSYLSLYNLFGLSRSSLGYLLIYLSCVFGGFGCALARL